MSNSETNDSKIVYDKSPIPSATRGGLAGERNPDLLICESPDGRLDYNSSAESGHVEIMIPSLPGSPRETETLHVRDFGRHVIGKIESSMARQGYLTTGATQSPAQVFAHYTAVAKGAALMDAAAISRMETLAKEFATEPDQEEFYSMVVKPYLGTLTPHRRR